MSALKLVIGVIGGIKLQLVLLSSLLYIVQVKVVDGQSETSNA